MVTDDGTGGAGYDFGEGDLLRLLILIGRVSFFCWLRGTDKKEWALDTLLRWSMDDECDALLRNNENPKVLGLFCCSCFGGGGGGLFSSAKLVIVGFWDILRLSENGYDDYF